MNIKLNKILAEISAGELIDKITILEIKKAKIKNKEKLSDIEKELKSLNETSADKIPNKSEIKDLIDNLKRINLRLWDIEENKRLAEKNITFFRWNRYSRATSISTSIKCFSRYCGG
mgnify:CR=1 FL=1